MMHIIMRPDAVYLYPIWLVGLSMAAGAVGGSLALELVVRRFVSARIRRRHNVLTAAIFSIVGTTYAVLLAFVAMLAWDGYGAASATASHEAALLLDVDRTASGLADPARTAIHDAILAYADAVVASEWPAQAEGHAADVAGPTLDRMEAAVVALRPTDAGQSNLQASLLGELDRLRDARNDRIAAAARTIPTIVWFVVIAGGAITMVFAALLGTTSLRLHLLLAALLALSGVLVLVLIVALSHPFRGDFRVTPEAFESALAHMRGG